MVRSLCSAKRPFAVDMHDLCLTPFFYSLICQNTTIANYFLDICPHILQISACHDENALFLASSFELVRRIYHMDPSLLDQISSHGDTPVHVRPANSKSIAATMYLLRKRPTLLSVQNQYCETPLREAYGNHPALVNAILAWKPNWHEPHASDGLTVLHMIATHASSTNIVRKVLRHSLSDLTTVASMHGRRVTPYFCAIFNNNVYATQVLERYETFDSIRDTHAIMQKDCWPRIQPIVAHQCKTCFRECLLPELAHIIFEYLQY